VITNNWSIPKLMTAGLQTANMALLAGKGCILAKIPLFQVVRDGIGVLQVRHYPILPFKNRIYRDIEVYLWHILDQESRSLKNFHLRCSRSMISAFLVLVQLEIRNETLICCEILFVNWCRTGFEGNSIAE